VFGYRTIRDIALLLQSLCGRPQNNFRITSGSTAACEAEESILTHIRGVPMFRGPALRSRRRGVEFRQNRFDLPGHFDRLEKPERILARRLK
jgi:hypothetical protein